MFISQVITIHNTALYTTRGPTGQGRQSQVTTIKKKYLICLLAVVHHSIHSTVQNAQTQYNYTIIQTNLKG